MTVYPRLKAVDRLQAALPGLADDELAEVYNELFPEAPMTEDAARSRRPEVADTVRQHLSAHLENEELVDVWNVIFPRHRQVWFDEDTGMLHFEEEPVGVASDDQA